MGLNRAASHRVEDCMGLKFGRVARLCALLVAGPGLGACVSPMERAEPPARTLPPQTLATARTLDPAGTGEWPQEQWWRTFDDPQLDALVLEALVTHPSLKVARARLAQAAAQLDAARSNATAGFGAALDLTRQRFSVSGTVPPPVAGSTRTTARLALDFGYELDYAGRNEAAIAAAASAGLAATADAQAARLALASAVARAYFQLQKLFALEAIAARELVQAERRIALLAQRVGAGLDTEAALSRAQSVPPQLRAELARLQAARAVTRDQLAALAGQGPDRGLDIGPAPAARGPGAALPANLPLDLVGRRPDLVAARRRAEAVSHDVEVARARFMPNVNLLAFVGVASLGLDRLFAAGSGIAGAGPAVRLPLFSAGALQAGLREREAGYDLAVERYNELVIDAVREVADRVQTRRALEIERGERRRALAAGERTRHLALERYRAGIANYLDVLDAEDALFGLQRAGADLNGRILQAEVDLVRALGGGYDDGSTRAR